VRSLCGRPRSSIFRGPLVPPDSSRRGRSCRSSLAHSVTSATLTPGTLRSNAKKSTSVALADPAPLSNHSLGAARRALAFCGSTSESASIDKRAVRTCQSFASFGFGVCGSIGRVSTCIDRPNALGGFWGVDLGGLLQGLHKTIWRLPWFVTLLRRKFARRNLRSCGTVSQ
jgi:hypothetical protein